MLYVSCPKCGRKLLEGVEGSSVQVKCTKCNLVVKATLQENGIALKFKQPTPKPSG